MKVLNKIKNGIATLRNKIQNGITTAQTKLAAKSASLQDRKSVV